MANKVYRAVETPVVFRESGGDAVLTLNNLANGAGRVSAQYDRGAGSKSRLHEVRFVVRFNATVALGVAVELYLFQSDGTYQDGNVGISDAAFTTGKRNNGLFLGALIADVVTNNVDNVVTFQNVPLSSRYLSVGVWNASAVNLQATDNASRVIITPQPDEIQ